MRERKSRYRRRKPKTHIYLALGLTLLIIGIWGTIYSIQVSRAQYIYYRLKFKSPDIKIDDLLRKAEKAHRIYPHNYYLAYMAAGRSYDAALDATNEVNLVRYLHSANHWCDTGIRLNPYRDQIIYLKVQLLEAQGDLPAAIKTWEDFVDLEYWNPEHHAKLADLYIKVYDLEKAEFELALIKKKSYSLYTKLKPRVDKLRKRLAAHS